jgi:hypothetical protein
MTEAPHWPLPTVSDVYKQHGLPNTAVGWDLLLALVGHRHRTNEQLVDAVRTIRTEFGNVWLGAAGSYNHDRPEFITNAWCNNHAAELTIGLANQIDVCRHLPRYRRIRKGMLRGDRGEWLHSLLQFEVATLSRHVGYNVEFEPSLPGLETNPADLRLTTLDDDLFIETRVVLKSDLVRKNETATDRLFALHREVEHLTGFSFVLDASGLEREITTEFIEELETIMHYTLSIDGWPIYYGGVGVDRCSAQQRVAIGPSVIEPGWYRIRSVIREKAIKYAAGRVPVWMRIDALDGFWQFTPLQTLNLREKLLFVTELLTETLPSTTGVAGVVLSSGLLQAQGVFQPETVHLPNQSFAMRSLVGTFGVREILIIPFDKTGMNQSPTWHQLYSNEAELRHTRGQATS